jgi:RNA polymerase sigma-70 factor (ECF subfamily)
MLAFARRFLPREHDAQDALQDAMLSAFRSIANFDGRSQLSTWLMRITVNACLMQIRTRRRRPERSIETLLPTFLPDGHQVRDTPRWVDVPPSGLETDRVTMLVRDGVDELPELYRTVLLLRDVEELSTEETAEVLGISKDAVKTRLHRARQGLRAILEPGMCGQDEAGMPGRVGRSGDTQQ